LEKVHAGRKVKEEDEETKKSQVKEEKFDKKFSRDRKSFIEFHGVIKLIEFF
jgi:hypothetical protein